jgi:hypothetical protein
MVSHPSIDNPWQDETSSTGQNSYQGQGYQNHNPYSTYQEQDQHPALRQDPHAQHAAQSQYQPPDHPPPNQQPLSSQLPSQPQHYQGDGHGSGDLPSDQNTNPWGSQHAAEYQIPHQQPLSSHPTQYSEDVPPGLPPRRTATDLALPTGQDRSHQIEVMQSYEAAGRKDEHDQNVEMLQREFPKLDGSLIAAIYGDSKSLSATREMLGELEG